MGMRLWGAILVLVAAAQAQTYYSVNGACTLGGQATVTQGMPSSGTRPLRGSTTFNGTGVMASYPGCTVTVFQTGSNTPAQIYSTAYGGAQANPFTADLLDGSWVFFAAAACYDVRISSGSTQSSVMPNSKTFPGVCAGAGSGGGGGGTTPGTSVTVNGTAAVPNQLNFTNTLLPPANSTVVNFLLNGNTVGAYITGTGGGGGGGTPLPTTPQWDLFASNSAGAAVASGVAGELGFLRAQVIESTGDTNPSPPAGFTPPNGSLEYFPHGGYGIGGNNGLAIHFSHSSIGNGVSPGWGNGGIALGGGNASGTNYQIYLDCESSPLGCDFKVPLTVNGTAVGGGGGGTPLPNTPAWDIFASTGSGGAQSAGSGVKAESGFLEGKVLQATGAGSIGSPFNPPNASMEYFPNGGYGIGGANGLAIHFSHSGTTTNGGIALAGGNTAGGATFQIYLDCEASPLGCDFKVPVTVNGAAIGGGGGIVGATSNGGLVVTGNTLGLLTTCSTNQYLNWNGTAWVCATLPGGGGGVTSINTVAGAFTFTGAGVSCSGTTCTFAGGGGGGSGTVASGTAGHFAWYSAAGTTVGSNANLDDSITTAATITSTEPLAAPKVNVNGTAGTGLMITSPGGSLPSLAGTNTSAIGFLTRPASSSPAVVINLGTVDWFPVEYIVIEGVGPKIDAAHDQIFANFNSTTPAAPASPAGATNVTWQRDNSGNISAWYVPGTGGGSGTITGATPNSGLVQSGTTLGLLNTCTANQILQYSGSNWVCIPTPTGGAGGVTSINTVAGAFTFSGAGVSCSGTTCTFTGGGGGGGGGAANQRVNFTTPTLSASLTSTIATSNLVWACYDNNTPANAIYPSNVSLDPATSTITFTFAVLQTGYCAINASGNGPTYVNSSESGLTWSIPASTHNLGALVNVRTYDSAGNEIFGNMQVNNTGDVTIAWLMAQSGKVVITQ